MRVLYPIQVQEWKRKKFCYKLHAWYARGLIFSKWHYKSKNLKREWKSAVSVKDQKINAHMLLKILPKF